MIPHVKLRKVKAPIAIADIEARLHCCDRRELSVPFFRGEVNGPYHHFGGRLR